VKASTWELAVQFLSGGNQQKVVIGKWLACAPKVLLLDEPTRGVDVGAKQEIYRLMHEMAVAGATILFASSDLEEVLSMSDRILVMHEGCLSGELQRGEFSEQAVMRLATGLFD
jgi:ribose transport system ATP-binding protein